MEQRPLRLGDILDDYCPRERRVTNHAVVAMIEEDVKQTRCTTCDTEHVYKGGKAPRRKKPETSGALYKEVLAGITDQDAPAAAVVNAAAPVPDDDDFDEADNVPLPSAPPVAMAAPSAPATPAIPLNPLKNDDIDPDERQPSFDEGPVHRPLIRAQLARPEGIKIERQAPEFTIRQNPNGRGGFSRGSNGGGPMRTSGGGGGGGRNGGGASNNNGHRFGRGPSRPGGGGGGVGGGRGGGPNQGFGGRGPGGSGGGQQRSGRPPKRSR
jgi:hypothetical protein